MQGVDLIITITDRDLSDEFTSWYRAHGISLVLAALGNGTATVDILDYLGLEQSEKSILFCVSPRSSRRIRQAERELWLDLPGRGILMTVALTSIGGTTTKDYLVQNQEGEEIMETPANHALIIVIANQGYSDLVMEAAREAGATGGTTVHAKGTGADIAKKFFGVSIASEREMLFILARDDDRGPIMKAVMSKAGINSEAQSLVFSVPVNDIAGLRTLDKSLDSD